MLVGPTPTLPRSGHPKQATYTHTRNMSNVRHINDVLPHKTPEKMADKLPNMGAFDLFKAVLIMPQFIIHEYNVTRLEGLR